MSRLAKNIGLALLFLVVVLILVNIFVIMPRMSLKPEHISASETLTTEKVTAEETVVTVDTLTIIKETEKGEGGIYIDSEDQSLRNPFFWPGERPRQKNAVKVVTTKPAPEKKPLLSMVIIGEGSKQALLDNVFVQEGEMFHGYVVKRIAENEVVLSDDLGELKIYLESGDAAGGQDQPPAGLIER